MAWIKVQDTLPDHRKVIGAASVLKIDKDAFVGKLLRLWLWMLSQRENGFLRESDAETVADVMRYRGKPAKLMAALLDAGLLDSAEGGYVVHDWEDSMGALLTRREEQRAKTRERVKKHRERNGSCNAEEGGESEDKTDECNVSVTRYTSVTHNGGNAPVMCTVTPAVTPVKRSCNTDVTPSRVRVRDIYIDDDDDYRAGAQAGARTRTQAPAREEDLREDEKSVLEDERFDGRLDSAQSAVRLAYLDAFGREALPAEVESIVRAAVISGTVEVAGEAVRRAAQHGARSVVPYVKTLLDQWAREGVSTVDELTDYEFQADIEEGRLPRWLRPGGSVKA